MINSEPISLDEQTKGDRQIIPPFLSSELTILKERYKNSIEVYPTSEQTWFHIITHEFVGYIALSNHTIRIRPKIPKANILFMLGYALDDLTFANEEISFPLDDQIHDILIRMLLRKVNRIIEEGLFKSYKETEDNLPYLRGKILFNQQLRYNLILRNRMYCRYTDLTFDVLENQIIKNTIINLLNRPGLNKDFNSALLRIRKAFQFVSDIDMTNGIFANIQFTRLNERYKSAIKICEILWRNASLDINDMGEYQSFSFLIDMNRLFEDFVRDYLKHELAGYEVEKGHKYLDENKRIELKPDIVIRRGNSIVLIVDTKYKILDEREPDADDIRQVLSDCIRYRIRNGLLLYPKLY